jgi:hypothetical protein
LITYISEYINKTFAEEPMAISANMYLDYLSSITADGLFDLEELAYGVDQTFNSISLEIAAFDQSGAGTGSALLLQSVVNASVAPRVLSYRRIQSAQVQTVPFWVGLAVLVLLRISITLMFPTLRRRTPLDVSYTANVLSMIYDSSLMGIVAKDDNAGFESLKYVRFAIGIFTGLSGKQRLGIDVADKVRAVKSRGGIGDPSIDRIIGVRHFLRTPLSCRIF